MAKAKPAGGRVFEAAESFTTVVDGREVQVVAGHTRVREGHPLLAGREQFFRPLLIHYDVEQATAGPGEVRGED